MDTPFTVGERVVVMHYARYGVKKRENMGAVRKVWKNGVVEVEYEHSAYTFTADGCARGERADHLQIRHLAANETPESIEQAEAALRQAQHEAAAAAEVERKQRIATWWQTTGRALWDTRTILPTKFVNREVAIITYTRHDETYCVMLCVDHDLGYKPVRITTGGLHCWRPERPDAIVSGGCGGNGDGDTLEEALYNTIA